VQEISAWPNVRHADAVLFGVVSSADHPIITCFGVTAADARIRNASWLQGNSSNFAQHSDDVVLGERAAEFLSASLNSHVQIGHGTFHVIGIVKTANGFEDGGVFMPLAAAQSFFHKENSSSVITVKLKDKDGADAFKQQVKAKYATLIALEDAEFTRIREIAILRVNGFSNLQVAGIIFGESALLSIFGALTGLTIGACLLLALKHVPALHGYVDVAIDPAVVLIVILLAFLTGVAGALYPAVYAMRVRAVEALRFE